MYWVSVINKKTVAVPQYGEPCPKLQLMPQDNKRDFLSCGHPESSERPPTPKLMPQLIRAPSPFDLDSNDDDFG